MKVLMRISGTRTAFLFALVLWGTPSPAGEPIHRCDAAEGTVFADKPCGEDSREIRVMPEGFVLPGTEGSASARLERMRELRKQGTAKTRSQGRKDSERLGYRERAELRQLRIRREGLNRDLQAAPRGSQRHTHARERLQKTERRISELEARK